MDKKQIKTLLLNYYEEKGKKIRPRSIQTYVANIVKLYKLIGEDTCNIKSLVLEPDNIINLICCEYINLNTLCTMLSTILIWLQVHYTPDAVIKIYRDKLTEMADKKSVKQKKKMKEDTKLGVDENILLVLYRDYSARVRIIKNKKKKKLSNTDKTIFKKNLILNLYNGYHVPPVRIDYNKMKVVDKFTDDLSNEFNYYDMENHKFIFLNYKTCNKYGKREVKIKSDELIQILSEYIEMIVISEDNPDKFLFLDKKNNVYSDNRFAKIIKTITGVGVCELRSLYLTKNFSDLQRVLRELKSVTNDMMNSPSVALSHYIKEIFSDDIIYTNDTEEEKSD